MGATAKGFGQSFFTRQVYDDAKDPLKYTVYLGQGGLTLPDRDYYLDASFAPQRAAYEAYVARMLTLAGWPDAAGQRQGDPGHGDRGRQGLLDPAERRDDDKTYNPYDVGRSCRRWRPGFNWNALLAGAGPAGRQAGGGRREHRLPEDRRDLRQDRPSRP